MTVPELKGANNVFTISDYHCHYNRRSQNVSIFVDKFEYYFLLYPS